MTYFSCYIDADTVVGDVPDHLKEIVACDNSLFEAWINAKKAERVIYFVDYLVWKKNRLQPPNSFSSIFL